MHVLIPASLFLLSPANMYFAVPLLSHQKEQPPHSIETFSQAALNVKELYLESIKTSSLLIVDTDGYLCMAAIP